MKLFQTRWLAFPALILIILIPTYACAAREPLRRGTPTDVTEPLAYNIPGAWSDRDIIQATADGRWIVFRSRGGNLVPNDTNGREDIFLYDVLLNVIQRVNVNSAGSESLSSSNIVPQCDVSNDGRYVAFSTAQDELVPSDVNQYADVFVRDTMFGSTTRISVASTGTEGDNESYGPSMSGDGMLVAFSSAANNLVPGDSNYIDVFLKDILTGDIMRISNPPGGLPNGSSFGAILTENGRYVTYSSNASNLVAGDTNFRTDVFQYDRLTQSTIRVSLATDGSQPDANCSVADVSADGRFVVFLTQATNLGYPVSQIQVYVRDTVAGTTTLASVDPTGLPANGNSFSGSISPDGRFVLFRSNAPVFSSSNDQLVLRDTVAGTTQILTSFVGGVTAERPAWQAGSVVYSASAVLTPEAAPPTPSKIYAQLLSNGAVTYLPAETPGLLGTGGGRFTWISGDGDYVLFEGGRTISAEIQSNLTYVFLKRLSTGDISLVSRTSNGDLPNASCGEAKLNASRNLLVFSTFATNMMSGAPSRRQIYTRDLVTNVVSRISVGYTGAWANQDCTQPQISEDGRYISYQTAASNIVANDTNAKSDVFRYDRLTGTTVCVSTTPAGVPGNDQSTFPSMTADGNNICFQTDATDLTGSGYSGIYVKDMTSGSYTYASCSSSGAPATDSFYPRIASDGRFVVFYSLNTMLTPEASQGCFVKDLLSGDIQYASKGTNGLLATDASTIAISGNGQVVTFNSPTLGVTPGSFSEQHLYRRVLGTGQVEEISLTTKGLRSTTVDSALPLLNYDGTVIVFGGSMQIAGRETQSTMPLIRRVFGTSGPIVPTSYTIQRGRFVSGGLTSLLFRDSDQLRIYPGATLTSAQNPVAMIFEGTSPVMSPSSVTFGRRIISSATLPLETVEAYDFGANSYVILRSEKLKPNDNYRYWDLKPAPNYVGPGGVVRVRIQLKSSQPVLTFPWDVRFDGITWFVAQ